MKVLVLGSGGREHALVWKLRQSARVSQLYCAPGNGGIADDAECLAVDVQSLESMTALATRLQPDLTVVGPELPLTLGVVDEFTRRGWASVWSHEGGGAVGVRARVSPRNFCSGITFPRHTLRFAIPLEQVRAALAHFHAPVVVKADGLAAGKGVVIAKSKEEAASGCGGDAEREDGGRGGIASGAGRMFEGGRAFVSGVQRWRARGAAGGSAGS